jgi:hypothetical protein
VNSASRRTAHAKQPFKPPASLTTVPLGVSMASSRYLSIFTPATKPQRQANFADYWEFTQHHGGALIEQEAKALELVLDGGSGYWAASAAEPGAIDIGTELDEVAKLLQLACTLCLNESAGRGRIVNGGVNRNASATQWEYATSGRCLRRAAVARRWTRSRGSASPSTPPSGSSSL